MNNIASLPIQVAPEHWEIIRNILQKYAPGHYVWAFGSRARKSATQFSDLDIVIDGKTKISSLAMSNLKDAFSESSLPWTVDIVDAHNSDSEFIRRISRD